VILLSLSLENKKNKKEKKLGKKQGKKRGKKKRQVSILHLKI
jgi:hypothetical protein